jgi:hypothetical protein
VQEGGRQSQTFWSLVYGSLKQSLYTTLRMTNTQDIEPLFLHPHAAANEPVTLHEGPLRLRDGAETTEGAGRLVLKFLPSTGLRLELDLASGATTPEAGAWVQAEVADSSDEALVTSIRTSIKEGEVSTKIEASISSFEKGPSAPLASAGFQIVNFPDFLTPGPKPAPVFGFPPMVADLQGAGWRARLTAVERSTDVFKSLKETGGYAFTHLGLLERSDCASFQAKDADGLLNALGAFLSFARGAACSLPVRWGIGADGGIVWQRWGSPIVDSWKTPDNWFDEHHGNLLSELFPAFLDAFTDPHLAEPFKLALHWYQKSNMRAGGMEGAIILGLTALDLLGALVVVDRTSAMGESKFDKLTAGEKLAKLLETMKVPTTIPVRLSELTAFATSNGWVDATAALAEIRHGYVHANKKRRTIVLAAPNVATFQAWQLSLWYQELALLYFLNHRGEYRNRLTAEWLGIVEKVPWL